MKCLKCGADLTDDTKFCSYCGAKVEENKSPEYDEIVEPTSDDKESVADVDTYEMPEYVPSSSKKSITEKTKEMFISYWNKIDLFCKIETIIGAIAVLLLIISVLNARILPIIFSLVQIGGLVVAFLLYKGKIKSNKIWMKFLVLALSALLTFINISSYSWIDRNAISEYFAKAVTPYSSQDCIGKNKETVKDDFILAGFSNIAEETIEDLEITETDRYGEVDNISINGNTTFEGNKEYKAASKIIIRYHSYKKVAIPLSPNAAKSMQIEEIIKAFEEAGFVNIKTDEVYDLDPETTKVEFENRISIDGTNTFDKDTKFPQNAEVKIVTHKPYEIYNLKIVIDFIPNLIFNKYDVEFEIDGNYETLSHGKDATFEYKLKQGEYTVWFTSADASSVEGEAEINLTGDMEVSYKIYCHSDKISVDTLYVENKGAVGENEAMVPSSASNCKFKNYKDIEKIFKDAGFTNIKTEILYDIVLGWTEEGEVDKVSINGKTDFNRGDIFAKDASVTITYHMKEEDDPNKPEEMKDTSSEAKDEAVSYSTNTMKTVKNGNSGVYSYRSRGGQYYNYYIIDFDEGYVYYFTEGNGDTSCDRLKIQSGDLNDKVIITYHDGGDVWSYGLHFKWKNQPDHLIMQDNDGFEFDFYTTDLEDALELKNKKTI